MNQTPQENQTTVTTATETWTDSHPTTGGRIAVTMGWTGDGRLALLQLAATDEGTQVTARTLRRLPFDRIAAALAPVVEDVQRYRGSDEAQRGEPLAFFTERSDEPAQPPSRGRPPLYGPEHWQRVADLYREATAVTGSAYSRRPAAFIVERWPDAPWQAAASDPERRMTQARRWVHEARKRGYLQPAPQKGART